MLSRSAIMVLHEQETRDIMTITINIDKARIYDLLITGIEGGSDYWAQIEGDYAQAIRDAEKPGVRSAFGLIDLRDGSEVWEGGMGEHDEERRPPMGLNDAFLMNGLKVMAKEYPKHFSDFLEENEDAITGDVFMQCVYFGEVIYG